LYSCSERPDTTDVEDCITTILSCSDLATATVVEELSFGEYIDILCSEGK